jgi:hypothetical protein
MVSMGTSFGELSSAGTGIGNHPQVARLWRVLRRNHDMAGDGGKRHGT